MGPLAGIRIIEMAGIGPGPFAAMMLSDMGAEVIRIDRTGRADSSAFDRLKSGGCLNRGRRSIALDLKKPEAIAAVHKLVGASHGLLEGFRPGVMERLGLGPQVCLGIHPALVYGRVTGWGQHGPLAPQAGHDINYIALTGALHAIGGRDAPVPPLNVVGDFAGGAMMVAFGMVCALLEASRSGRGQVVDAAMTDGAALLMAMQYSFKAMGHWQDVRASNLLDGGAPFYGTYACADGKWLAVGPIEPQFHAALLDGLGVDAAEFDDRWDSAAWPRLRARLSQLFLSRTRAAWCERFDGTDACVTPVLDLDEAPRHPHNVARGTFIEHAGVMQPAPAPRFSRSTPEIQCPPAAPGEHTHQILKDWHFSADEIERLRACGAI